MSVQFPETQVVHFPGISVTLPGQFGSQGRIVIKDVPSDLSPSNGFIPIRIIINIAIQNVDNPETYLTSFDPPLRLDVGYKKQDLFEAAQNAQSLKLAYHDGKQWNVFTPETHQFRLLPPSTASAGGVEISQWSGDPPIAWGR